MNHSHIDNLIDAFCCLPGVGPKSAQRMVYHLLQRDRIGGLQLSDALLRAMTDVGHCQCCRTFTEQELCSICKNVKRENGQICIVETPANIPAIEATGQFSGRYFVLMGRLSPLDGIGPEELGLTLLNKRLKEEHISEVILATNPTVEGEATAHYIAQLCSPYNILVTRIAHGVPMGGELEFVDGTTLAHSFMGRQLIDY